MLTNEQRANFAQDVMVRFIDSVGDTGDDQTNLADLLGDLMHWADQYGCDFERALETSRFHYDAEISEENA